MTRPDPTRMTLAALLAGLALCGCASTGPAPAGKAVASAAKPAVGVAPATVAPAPAGQGGRPEFPGFARVVRNGEDYFCQTRNPTGSRARVAEICYTRDAMKKMEEANRQMWKDAGAGSSSDTLKMGSPK